MADEIKVPVKLVDDEAIGPLRRIGNEAKKAGDEAKRQRNETKKAGDEAKRSNNEGAKASDKFTKKQHEAAEMAKKLAAEIKRIDARAKFAEAKKASADYQSAIERLTTATKKHNNEVKDSSKNVKLVGAGAVAAYTQIAQAAMQAFSQVKQLLDQLLAFGKEGASSIDIDERFNALGDAVPSIEKLRDAVRGTVDDTTLQKFAIMANEMGLSSEAAEGFASRVVDQAAKLGMAADAGALLTTTLKGGAETLKQIGINADISADGFDRLKTEIVDQGGELAVTREEYEKMSEAQRRIVIFTAQAEIGIANQGKTAETAGQQFAQVDATIANVISNMQVMTAQLLINSGALDAIKQVAEAVGNIFEKNRDTIKRLVDQGVGILVDMLPSAIDSFSGLASMAKLLMGAIAPIMPLLQITTKALMAPISVIGALVEKWRSMSIVKSVLDGVRAALEWLNEAVDTALGAVNSLMDTLGLTEDSGLASVGTRAQEIMNGLADAHERAANAAKKQADQTERITTGYQSVVQGRGFGLGSEDPQIKIQQQYDEELKKYRDRVFKKTKSNETFASRSTIEMLGLSGLQERASFGIRSLAQSEEADTFAGAFSTGTRAAFDPVRSLGLGNLQETFGGLSGLISQARDSMASFNEEYQRTIEANQELTMSIQETLAGGFLGAYDAIINGTGSFREQMMGVIGGMLDELAVAFGAWAATEIALFSGNPFAAAITVGLMRIAAKKVANLGKRSTGGTTSTSGESRYMAKRQDNQMTQKTLVEVNINTIPVPDRISKELAAVVTRGLKLNGG